LFAALANGSLIGCAFACFAFALAEAALAAVLVAGFLLVFPDLVFAAGLPLVPVAFAPALCAVAFVAGLPLVPVFFAFIFSPLYFDLSGDISSRWIMHNA
jgi:hypothetical protein